MAIQLNYTDNTGTSRSQSYWRIYDYQVKRELDGTASIIVSIDMFHNQQARIDGKQSVSKHSFIVDVNDWSGITDPLDKIYPALMLLEPFASGGAVEV